MAIPDFIFVHLKNVKQKKPNLSLQIYYKKKLFNQFHSTFFEDMLALTNTEFSFQAVIVYWKHIHEALKWVGGWLLSVNGEVKVGWTINSQWESTLKSDYYSIDPDVVNAFLCHTRDKSGSNWYVGFTGWLVFDLQFNLFVLHEKVFEQGNF